MVHRPLPVSRNRGAGPLLLLLLPVVLPLLLLAQASPGRAGSATADSVWDRRNALQRALQQVPAGATVTGQHCLTIEVGLDNFRYRCTVEWTTTPEPASPEPAAPSPAAPQTPASGSRAPAPLGTRPGLPGARRDALSSVPQLTIRIQRTGPRAGGRGTRA